MSVRAATAPVARQSMSTRADQLLVERGIAPDLATARALLMSGRVHGDDRRFTQPGQRLPVDTPLHVRTDSPYVSRGGEKLAAALETWPISPAGRDCLDVGAATGGFTDALLQHGAAHVTAVDVGYGQLHPRLRNNDRVTVLERTNIRDLPPPASSPDLAVVDVSFIGLRQVLPAIARALIPGADIIALVKPQFEAPREDVDQRGVVHDRRAQAAAVSAVVAWAVKRGWRVGGVLRSPLTGPAGNREWFLWLRTP